MAKLKLTNTDASNVFIDIDNVEAAKDRVKKDLKNAIAEIDALKKAYKTLEGHKATKGSWKSTATAATNAATKCHKNLSTMSSSLESKMNSSIISYVIAMVKNLLNAQATAQNIKTDAGTGTSK